MRTFDLLRALLLQVITVVGQQAYEDTSSLGPETPAVFHYHGCAEVDLSSFGDAITFSDDILTHAACQAACQGHSIAALFPDACRCGDDYNGFSPLDSSSCDYPCMGDPAYGMCGSDCPTKGPGISTIYITSDVLTTEFGDDPPDPGLSPSVLIATLDPDPSEEPTLVPQISSEPPSVPTGPPADPPAVLSKSTEPPDTTTRSTSRSATSSTETEVTLFPSANTTVSSTTSSTSFSTSEAPTPNVERDHDDPPSPSQILQADVDDLQAHSLSFIGTLALVIAAAV